MSDIGEQIDESRRNIFGYTGTLPTDAYGRYVPPQSLRVTLSLPNEHGEWVPCELEDVAERLQSDLGKNHGVGATVKAINDRLDVLINDSTTYDEAECAVNECLFEYGQADLNYDLRFVD